MRHLKHRVLEQELLDTLPHDDPDALASRQDIDFLNRFMGSFRWIERQLMEYAPGTGRVVELGAGDGALIRHIAERSPELASRWTGLDFAPPPAALPLGVQWVQGNFLQAKGVEAIEKAEVVVANLILHHLGDDQLQALAAHLKHACLILVNEPARYWRHCQESRLLNLICEFNHVTMYDMERSIQAGFRTGELPRVLILDRAEWEIDESHSLFGACRMIARRK